MHVGFGTTLFYLTVQATIIHLVVGAITCGGALNTTRACYFHMFQSSFWTNQHAYGCATDTTVVVDGDSRLTCNEIHVINIESNGPVDIYLNVNGILNEKTKTLPHCKDYKIEFALFSKEEVIWLVSMEDLPSSGVSIKIYCSSGSHVIFRDGQKLSPVYISLTDAKHMSSQNILNSCRKDGLFQQISSFTEVSAAQVASVNVLVGRWRGALLTLAGNFTDCLNLKRDYLSPTVSVEQYEVNQPLLNCWQKVIPDGRPSRKKAFILDVKSKSLAERRQVINLEVVETEAANSAVMVAAKTSVVVVLRSLQSCDWHVHFQRKLDVANFLFVVSNSSKLVLDDTSQNLDVEYRKLDYDEDDPLILTSSIESLYTSTVVAYSQYNGDADLVFLKLEDKQYDGNAGFSNLDSLLYKAHDILVQSDLSPCADNMWTLGVPIRALTQYGLTKENLELSFGNFVCQPHDLTQDLFYDLTQCSTVSEDRMRSVNMKVSFNVKTSNHLFTVPGPRTEIIIIPLTGCQKQKARTTDSEILNKEIPDQSVSVATSAIFRSCMEGLFVFIIPNKILATLDSSEISKCNNRRVFDDGTEFTIRSDDVSTCGAVFRDGLVRIEIQKNPIANGSQSEPIEISCSYSTEEAMINYSLRVFEDFNMRKQLRGTIPVKWANKDTDETTYHFQVLAASSRDRSLTVFLSRCSLRQNFREIQLLIYNNCPASGSVSFVRSRAQFSNRTQHFAVKMGGVLAGTGSHSIKCEVSACALEPCDHCIPSVPQCVHQHGDRCTESSAESKLRIAPYLESTVSSAAYFKIQASEIGPRRVKLDRPNGEDGEVEDAKNPGVAATFGAPTLVVLTLVAFVVGFAFFGILALVHNQYPRKRSESGRSSESSGTGSTKTTGSSLCSLFCPKIEKFSSPLKEDSKLERKPFITTNPTTTSAANPPQKFEVRSKKEMESSRNSVWISSDAHSERLANGKSTHCSAASALPTHARVEASLPCLAARNRSHDVDVLVHVRSPSSE